MKVVITNRARRDLLSLFEYNSRKSRRYAIRIDKKIRHYIKALEEFPYIGRYVPEILDKNYKERICEKFRIIYYISQNKKTVFILYIFSGIQYKETVFDLNINQNF